ncbi:septum formation inhibitor Maf [Paenibacillus zeisoli]|uniref:dTTP/UTP pyrophosphatase n=1 Tax=Paenibacillus zeisoli TaxID=2496267 RepID=A0A3S1D6B8_9BACL|nr:Maf family protein [Paenibacillus zeisoli]RUT27801.1 septum formation inhibitor Maf [Paenibacillus zeisoli]
MENNQSRQIILASSSPRRRELIAGLHIPFEIIPSHADETTPEDWAPERIVTELAHRKAVAVYQSLTPARTDSIIVGSDTIVVLNGRVLGKPSSKEEAASMLRALQGQSHQVFTGVSCIDGATGDTLTDYRVTKVMMRALSKVEIAAYAESGEGLDKAGAYAIQGLGATLVTEIQGCYFNVVGLPLSLLSEMLKKFDMYVL